MVEGARLESVYTGNCIEGSNPSVSAEHGESTKCLQMINSEGIFKLKIPIPGAKIGRILQGRTCSGKGAESSFFQSVCVRISVRKYPFRFLYCRIIFQTILNTSPLVISM